MHEHGNGNGTFKLHIVAGFYYLTVDILPRIGIFHEILVEFHCCYAKLMDHGYEFD